MPDRFRMLHLLTFVSENKRHTRKKSVNVNINAERILGGWIKRRQQYYVGKNGKSGSEFRERAIWSVCQLLCR